MTAPIAPERIAEIRAAWREDRHERIESLRQNWHWHALDFLFDFVGGSSLGICFGLAAFVYALSRVAA